MKGNKKILVIAALLLLIAASFTTYAIYRESVNATGSVDTANWSVKLGTTKFSEVADITFDLDDLTCATNPGKNNKIAPGAECYLEYTVDALGSEVDVVLDAELDETNSTNLPDNMEIVLKDDNGTEGPLTIPYSTSSMSKTIRLTVSWPGALTDDDTKDGEDLEGANKTVTIAAKLIARQSLE